MIPSEASTDWGVGSRPPLSSLGRLNDHESNACFVGASNTVRRHLRKWVCRRFWVRLDIAGCLIFVGEPGLVFGNRDVSRLEFVGLQQGANASVAGRQR